MANAAYDNLRSLLPQGLLDVTAATIKVTIVDSSYTFDATDVDIGDFSGAELAGGSEETVANFAVDSVGNVTADSVTFTGVTTGQTAAALIVWVDFGGGDTQLLWYFDTGSGFPLTTTGAAISVDWNATVANGTMFKVG